MIVTNLLMHATRATLDSLPCDLKCEQEKLSGTYLGVWVIGSLPILPFLKPFTFSPFSDQMAKNAWQKMTTIHHSFFAIHLLPTLARPIISTRTSPVEQEKVSGTNGTAA